MKISSSNIRLTYDGQPYYASVISKFELSNSTKPVDNARSWRRSLDITLVALIAVRPVEAVCGGFLPFHGLLVLDGVLGVSGLETYPTIPLTLSASLHINSHNQKSEQKLNQFYRSILDSCFEWVVRCTHSGVHTVRPKGNLLGLNPYAKSDKVGQVSQNYSHTHITVTLGRNIRDVYTGRLDRVRHGCIRLYLEIVHIGNRPERLTRREQTPKSISEFDNPDKSQIGVSKKSVFWTLVKLFVFTEESSTHSDRALAMLLALESCQMNIVLFCLRLLWDFRRGEEYASLQTTLKRYICIYISEKQSLDIVECPLEGRLW